MTDIFEFDVGAWKKDPCVAKCSLATRGFWLELLFAIRESPRRGQVTDTIDNISRICRCTHAETRIALDELQATKTARVYRRGDKYIVINRRMKREKIVEKSLKNHSPPDVVTNTKTKIRERNFKNQTPIGSCEKSSEEILALDLVLAEKIKELNKVIKTVLIPRGTEVTTFANIVRYLTQEVQLNNLGIGVFDAAKRWARQAARAKVKNKKGLFVEKIKEQTGFRAQKKLLE